MKSLKKIILLVLLGTFILSACGSMTSEPAPIPTLTLDNDNPAAPAETQSQVVTASAEIAPAEEAQVRATMSGKVQLLNAKIGDVVEAGEVLIELDAASLQAEVNRAEGALISAQAELDRLIRYGEIRERRTIAEGNLAQAEAALLATHLAQERAKLTAPISGVVVSVNTHLGEVVMPGEMLLKIVTLDQLQVETTDLSERDISDIKIGQVTMVYIEALDLEIEGKISEISPFANSIGGDTVYTTTIQLEETPASLRWGMSATVEITTD